MSYEREKGVAVEAVLKACRLCRAVRKNLVCADTLAKKDCSPVTVADFGVQAVVAAELAAAWPGVRLVGEEESSRLRADDAAELRAKVLEHVQALNPTLDEGQMLAAIDSGTYAGGGQGRHWTLDPIDGTKGFLRGDQYAIALALIEEGQVVLGVLGCPNLPLIGDDPSRVGSDEPHGIGGDEPQGAGGCLFVAVKGQGATMRFLDDDQECPVHVTAIDDPAGATFCESVEKEHTKQSHSARVAARLGITAPPLRMDSQCKYAAIARGQAAIYLRMPTRADYQERIWDHAAGWIIVTEAGGTVSDIHGRPLNFSLGRTLRQNQGVVATNGKLHEKVIAAIAREAG